MQALLDKYDYDITDEYLQNESRITSIPREIIPISTLEWKMDDPVLIGKMKSAANAERWESPTFIAHGLRWYMKIYPNGTDCSDRGWVLCYVCLAYLPPGLKTITTKYRSIIIDPSSNFICDSSKVELFYAANMGPKWRAASLAFDFKDMQKLHKLYFFAEIELCGITNRRAE